MSQPLRKQLELPRQHQHCRFSEDADSPHVEPGSLALWFHVYHVWVHAGTCQGTQTQLCCVYRDLHYLEAETGRGRERERVREWEMHSSSMIYIIISSMPDYACISSFYDLRLRAGFFLKPVPPWHDLGKCCRKPMGLAYILVVLRGTCLYLLD